MGVQEQQEPVARGPSDAVFDLAAVQGDGERPGRGVLPVVGCHVLAVWAVEGHLGRAPFRAAKVLAGPQGLVVPAQGDSRFYEGQQVLVEVVPVVPRQLVVLAVGIVVAILRPAGLVATEHHGDAGGKQ